MYVFKRTILLSLFVLCSSVATALPRIVVFPFKNPPGFEQECVLGGGLAELLRKRLLSSGKVYIVERADLERIREELNLSQDELFDPRSFHPKGGFLGADFAVFGKILDFGHFSKDTGLGTLGKMAGGFTQTKTTAYIRLGIEVVDLKNGKLIFSDECETREERKGTILLAGDIKKLAGGAIKIGSSEFDNSMFGRAVNKALDKLTPRLLALFKLESKVLAVSPDGIVLDIGSSSGIREGTKGKLFHTREIKNSNGEVVWQSKRESGEVIVIETQVHSSLATGTFAIEPKEGDVVSFYP